MEKIRKAAYDATVKLIDVFHAKLSDEPMIPLIEALAYDVQRIVVVNILNDGNFVQGVPMDFEVEIPALVSKRGIQGIHTNRLPQPVISYLLRDRVSSVELELQAYDKGDRRLLLQLIMMDPWTRSEEQAKEFLHDLPALPYHAEMQEHYK